MFICLSPVLAYMRCSVVCCEHRSLFCVTARLFYLCSVRVSGLIIGCWSAWLVSCSSFSLPSSPPSFNSFYIHNARAYTHVRVHAPMWNHCPKSLCLRLPSSLDLHWFLSFISPSFSASSVSTRLRFPYLCSLTVTKQSLWDTVECTPARQSGALAFNTNPFINFLLNSINHVPLH